MKTLLYRQALSLDALEMVDRAIPTPGPHELLVRVRAASLNYRDLAVARGTYGGFRAPLVPGSDASGDVVAVGAEVRRFAVGDRVSPAYVPDWMDGPPRGDVVRRRLGGPLDGVLSEYLVVHEQAAVRVPSHLSHEEAATLPVAAVSAWQALVADAGLRPGQWVGVSGTGGASLFVLQIARAAGARVVVVGRSASKLARAAALGASTVDASTHADWERHVLDLTGGAGVDVFVDMLGGAALSRSIAATRIGGTVSAFGFVVGTTAPLDLVPWIRRAVTLRATSGGSRASFEAVVSAMEAAGTKPVIDRVFAFSREDVRSALLYLAEGRAFGKIVVTLGEV